jgi:hypothetical protein
MVHGRPLCALAARVALVLLAFSAADTDAGEADRVALQVIDAYRGSSRTEAIAELARGSMVDPWLVAEHVCLRGEAAAASMFADACDAGAGKERLLAYVDGRRVTRRDSIVAEALARTRQERLADSPRQALTTLSSVTDSKPLVLSVMVRLEAAKCYRDLKEMVRSHTEYLSAAKIASRLGWATAVQKALREPCYHYCLQPRSRRKGGPAQGGDSLLLMLQKRLREGEVLVVPAGVDQDLVAVIVDATGARFSLLGASPESVGGPATWPTDRAQIVAE